MRKPKQLSNFVVVTNLPFETKEKDIISLFEGLFDCIQSVRLIRNAHLDMLA